MLQSLSAFVLLLWFVHLYVLFYYKIYNSSSCQITVRMRLTQSSSCIKHNQFVYLFRLDNILFFFFFLNESMKISSPKLCSTPLKVMARKCCSIQTKIRNKEASVQLKPEQIYEYKLNSLSCFLNRLDEAARIFPLDV